MASQSYAAQLKADTDQEQPLNVTPDYYTDVNPPPLSEDDGLSSFDRGRSVKRH